MLFLDKDKVIRAGVAALIALSIARVAVECRAGHGAELQGWRAAALQCGEQVAQQLHCGSCSAAWDQVSRCVADRVLGPGSGNGWVVSACIELVRSRTQNEPGAFDRIAPVLACSSRQPVR
jgi:hypothetical protein